MKFNEYRINRLIDKLVDYGVDLSCLLEELQNNVPQKEGLFSRLGKRFGNVKNKITSAVKSDLQDELGDWKGLFHKKSPLPPPTPISKPNSLDSIISEPELYGKLMGAKSKAERDAVLKRVNELDPPHTAPEVSNNIHKAQEAINTLKTILKDPKFASILSHLEQEVNVMDHPQWYHDMSSGEKQWYDKLSYPEKDKFNKEMANSGNKAIHQGDEDWQSVVNRSQKAYNQGYQDQGKNWNWAAGFTNRQRIRKDMNPDWAHSLQGESTGFKKWLAEDMNQMGNPTDPKEIQRRIMVNKITTDMMKKNNKLVPGKSDQQTVANALSNDPKIGKADPKIQQDISSFFLKQ